MPVASLLLSGIAVSQSLTAFMSLLMIFNVQSMNQIMFWTMGSLNGKGWDQVITVLPYVIIGCLILFTTVGSWILCFSARMPPHSWGLIRPSKEKSAGLSRR